MFKSAHPSSIPCSSVFTKGAQPVPLMTLDAACSLLSPPWELVIPLNGLSIKEKEDDGERRVTASDAVPSTTRADAGDRRGREVSDSLLTSYPLPPGAKEVERLREKGKGEHDDDGVSRLSNSFLILRERRPILTDLNKLETPSPHIELLPRYDHHIGAKRPREECEDGVNKYDLHCSAAATSCFTSGALTPEAELEVWLVRCAPLMTCAPSVMDMKEGGHNSKRSTTCEGLFLGGGDVGGGGGFARPAGDTDDSSKWLPSAFLNQAIRPTAANVHNPRSYREDERSVGKGGDGDGPQNTIPSAKSSLVPLPYGETVVTWHGVSTLAELCPKGLSFKSFATLFRDLIIGATGSGGNHRGEGFTAASVRCGANTKETGARSVIESLPISTISQKVAADLLRYVGDMSAVGVRVSEEKKNNNNCSSSSENAVLLSCVVHNHEVVSPLVCAEEKEEEKERQVAGQLCGEREQMSSSAAAFSGGRVRSLTPSVPPPSSFLGIGHGGGMVRPAEDFNRRVSGGNNSYSADSNSNNNDISDSLFVHYLMLNQNSQGAESHSRSTTTEGRNKEGHTHSCPNTTPDTSSLSVTVDFTKPIGVSERLRVAAKSLAAERQLRIQGLGGGGAVSHPHDLNQQQQQKNNMSTDRQEKNSLLKVVLTPNMEEITRQMMMATSVGTLAGHISSTSFPYTGAVGCGSGGGGGQHNAEKSMSSALGAPPPVVRVDICLSTEEGFGQLNFATFHLKLSHSPFTQRLNRSFVSNMPSAGCPYPPHSACPIPPLPPPHHSNIAGGGGGGGGGGTAYSVGGHPVMAPSSSFSSSSSSPFSPSFPSVVQYLRDQSLTTLHHQQWSCMVPSLVGSQSLLCDELVSVTSTQLAKEEEMLSAFVVLLNEKKKKIRELLDTAQQQQTVILSQRGEAERQKEEIERLKRSLEEEKRHNAALQQQCAQVLYNKKSPSSGGGGDDHRNTGSRDDPHSVSSFVHGGIGGASAMSIAHVSSRQCVADIDLRSVNVDESSVAVLEANPKLPTLSFGRQDPQQFHSPSGVEIQTGQRNVVRVADEGHEGCDNFGKRNSGLDAFPTCATAPELTPQNVFEGHGRDAHGEKSNTNTCVGNSGDHQPNLSSRANVLNTSTGRRRSLAAVAAPPLPPPQPANREGQQGLNNSNVGATNNGAQLFSTFFGV